MQPRLQSPGKVTGEDSVSQCTQQHRANNIATLRAKHIRRQTHKKHTIAVKNWFERYRRFPTAEDLPNSRITSQIVKAVKQRLSVCLLLGGSHPVIVRPSSP